MSGAPQDPPDLSTPTDQLTEPTDGPAAELGHGIIDVTGVPLTELWRTQNPVLVRCLERLLNEADDPQEAIAGFNSAA